MFRLIDGIRGRGTKLYPGGNRWDTQDLAGGGSVLVDSGCPDEIVKRAIALSEGKDVGLPEETHLGSGKFGDVHKVGRFAIKVVGGDIGGTQSIGFGANSIAANEAVRQGLDKCGFTWGGLPLAGVAIRAAVLPVHPEEGNRPVWVLDYIDGRPINWQELKPGDVSDLKTALSKAVRRTRVGMPVDFDIHGGNILYGSGAATKIDSMPYDNRYVGLEGFLRRNHTMGGVLKWRDS